jgi:hypothetical protein
MPVLKKKDINLLCKAENAIKQAFIKLDTDCIDFMVTDFEANAYVPDTFTRDDYWELVALIESLMTDRAENRKRVLQYHKDHPEKHREYNRKWARNKKAKENKDEQD